MLLFRILNLQSRVPLYLSQLSSIAASFGGAGAIYAIAKQVFSTIVRTTAKGLLLTAKLTPLMVAVPLIGSLAAPGEDNKLQNTFAMTLMLHAITFGINVGSALTAAAPTMSALEAVALKAGIATGTIAMYSTLWRGTPSIDWVTAVGDAALSNPVLSAVLEHFLPFLVAGAVNGVRWMLGRTGDTQRFGDFVLNNIMKWSYIAGFMLTLTGFALVDSAMDQIYLSLAVFLILGLALGIALASDGELDGDTTANNANWLTELAMGATTLAFTALQSYAYFDAVERLG